MEPEPKEHVFVCMLAYKLMFHIYKLLKDKVDYSTKHIIACLDKIQYTSYSYQGNVIKKLPAKLHKDQQQILDTKVLPCPKQCRQEKFINEIA